jgi:hypothetical protein
VNNSAPHTELANDKKSNDITFFAMPLWRLALLSFFTAGIYDIYWFYRSWKAIQIAQPQKMRPFWRAVFAIFYAWPLFKDILTAAKSHGYQKLYSPGLLAAVYIIANLIGNGLSRADQYTATISSSLVAMSLVSIIPLVLVQKAINYNNEHIQSEAIPETSTAEKLVIAAGIVLFVFATLGAFTLSN